MFENLAQVPNVVVHPGVHSVDDRLMNELYCAKIPRVSVEQSMGEVPYSFIGRLREWTFVRAAHYWRASAPLGQGLPLEAAIDLYGRRYPMLGEDEPWRFGQVVRVDGLLDGVHPRGRAKHFDAAGRQVILDPDGTRQRAHGDYLARHAERLSLDEITVFQRTLFVPSVDGVEGLRSFIDSYHVDTQCGLDELAQVIKG